jgi:Mor family transcriptional regulator
MEREQKPIIERLMNKVIIGDGGAWMNAAKQSDDDPCWYWIGGKGRGGYGQMKVDGKMKGTHRVSYECFRGDIPEGMCVLHACDVPACVNPAHLFVGTTQDNVDDKMAKGRLKPNPGDKNGNSKITEDDVLKIREASAAGESYDSIAKRFPVDKTNIGYIVRRKTWAHVHMNKDNAYDREVQGRRCVHPGEKNGNSKITEADVLKIRAESAAGESNTSIAKRFSVSNQSVSNIVLRKSWTHVQPGN